MEWAVLVGFAVVAAVLVGLPRMPRRASEAVEAEREAALLAERERLLEELRELDDDHAAGRIAAEDRQAGRRAIAPRLRAVTEELRVRGVETRGVEPAEDRAG